MHYAQVFTWATQYKKNTKIFFMHKIILLSLSVDHATNKDNLYESSIRVITY